MPISVIACQSRCIEADHQTRVAEPDLGDEPLEAAALDLAVSRFSKILIDDDDTIRRPAQSDGSVHQAVLKFGAFLMVAHLVYRGLAYINVSEL
ncbi:hypothetical protein MesoLjLa_67010 (plasmid) [Mesorhizobium sp. L-2-11]|nr:hypothetical protein MesoLjLa_67010 [Mesorhizobium sp. L-2-11]